MDHTVLIYKPITTVTKSVLVTVEEISCSDDSGSSLNEDISKSPSHGSWREISQSSITKFVHHAPRVHQLNKAREGLKIARQVLDHTLHDKLNKRPSISEPHQYARRIVNPLFTWGGKNTRVLTGHSLGSATIRDGKSQKNVIHAASHNYMGFYKPTPESEALHHLALQSLPITRASACHAMRDAFHTTLANFFSADFAFTTSTGYASNLVAFPAILDADWLVILDEKSHNSMNVGCYMSNVQKVARFRHNDMSQLETLLLQYFQQNHHIMVAVEGLYSMDGTIPPLKKLASLKDRFGFTLLVDEAHSFLSVGSTGHGCLELWNETHPNATVDADLIDIRTATLSKSLGSIGGLICGKNKYKEAVYKQAAKLEKSGMNPVLTATMVQCLHILNQPAILRRRLERMRRVIAYAREELQRFGIHVYGEAHTPLLPIHCGPPSLASKMSYVLNTKGILATPVSKPAVAFWESRIRVCLSADHTDEMVNLLVRRIIEAAQEIGITKKRILQPRTFCSSHVNVAEDEDAETKSSFQNVADLIASDRKIAMPSIADQDTIQAGHLARRKFGVAAGGSRWVSGTFTIHEELESLMTQTTGLSDTMTYADNYLGLSSTIAALCRPLTSQKRHEICIARNAPLAILDGIKIAPKKNMPSVRHYSTIEEVDTILQDARKSDAQQITLTINLTELSDDGSLIRKLQAFQASKKIIPGLTILVYNSEQNLQSRKGQQNLRDIIDLLRRWAKNVLVYGSFFDAFGVPGAYLAGTAEIIEEFRYSSRGYMFSTAPLPFTVAMTLQSLQQAADS